MRTIYFAGCRTSKDVDEIFKTLSEAFKLSERSGSDPVTVMLTEEYKSFKERITESEKKNRVITERKQYEQIIAEAHARELEVEVCGTWLWVAKNAYKYRKALMDLGFRYSKNKKAFYWRPDNCKSSNEEPLPMEAIRQKYGTKVLEIPDVVV